MLRAENLAGRRRGGTCDVRAEYADGGSGVHGLHHLCDAPQGILPDGILLRRWLQKPAELHNFCVSDVWFML